MRGDMNITILLALVIAGLAVAALARIVVASLARKGARAPETTR
ncbi:MAG: hypothetical protein WBV46_10780 [Terriglobales bacterium]|jgi:hypothetical protein